MAIALLTTFYGLVMAHFFFAPLAGKLAAHIHRETLMLNIVFDGVVAMCDQRAPMDISRSLQAYIQTTGTPLTAAPSRQNRQANRRVEISVITDELQSLTP